MVSYHVDDMFLQANIMFKTNKWPIRTSVGPIGNKHIYSHSGEYILSNIYWHKFHITVKENVDTLPARTAGRGQQHCGVCGAGAVFPRAYRSPELIYARYLSHSDFDN